LERVDPVTMMDDLHQLLQKSKAARWIVDVFPANHALTTGVAYVQYLQEKRQAVLEATQQSLAIIIDQQRMNNMEMADNPQIVNAGASITPTIQTDTMSNSKSSSIPTGRYADVVKNHIEDATSAETSLRYIPRTIQIQPIRFAECLNGNDHTAKVHRDRQEEGTLTTGNTSSGKTEKELELEAKNERLEKEVEALKKGLQNLQLQMVALIAALNDKKTKVTTPQRKKYNRTGTHKDKIAPSDDELESEVKQTHTNSYPARPQYLRPPQNLYENDRDHETTDNLTNPEEGPRLT
jgi:hypothetical protein